MYWITQQNFVGPKYNKRFEKSNTSLTFKNTKNSIQLFQMREDSGKILCYKDYMVQKKNEIQKIRQFKIYQ